MASVHVKQEPGCPTVRPIKQEPRETAVRIKTEPGISSSAAKPISTRVSDGASTSASAPAAQSKSSSRNNNNPNHPRVNAGSSASATTPATPSKSSSGNNNNPNHPRMNAGASASATTPARSSKSSSKNKHKRNHRKVNDGASTSAAPPTTPSKSSSTNNNIPNHRKVNDGASTSAGTSSTPLRFSRRLRNLTPERVNKGPSTSAGTSAAPNFIPLKKRRSRGNRKKQRQNQKLMGGHNGPTTKSGRVTKKRGNFGYRISKKNSPRPQSNIAMSFTGRSEPSHPLREPKIEPKAQMEKDDAILVLSDSEVEIIDEVQHAEPTRISAAEVIVIDKNENAFNKENIQQGESTAGQRLRPIIIDGSNVAMFHGLHSNFSWRGIQICIDYFLTNGHRDIKVFVPAHRKCGISQETRQLIEDLELRGLLVFTPSRYVNGKLIISEDDRFIIEYATKSQGVIVSRDQYRDMMQENRDWREAIEKRLLQFTFVGDTIMFPLDPMGRNGPHLSQFLRFPNP